jgi:hypothetical protein
MAEPFPSQTCHGVARSAEPDPSNRSPFSGSLTRDDRKTRCSPGKSVALNLPVTLSERSESKGPLHRSIAAYIRGSFDSPRPSRPRLAQDDSGVHMSLEGTPT